MKILTFLVQQTPILQILKDALVGVLDEEALPRSHLIRKLTLGIHRLNYRQPVFLPHFVIVCSEGGSGMDDAGPFFHADKIRQDHVECLRFLGFDKTVERLIFESFQLSPFESFLYLIFSIQGLLTEGFRQDQILTPMFHLHIVDIRTHCQSHVGNQGPGSGGPDEEVCVRLIKHFHLHIN